MGKLGMGKLGMAKLVMVEARNGRSPEWWKPGIKEAQIPNGLNSNNPRGFPRLSSSILLY